MIDGPGARSAKAMSSGWLASRGLAGVVEQTEDSDVGFGKRHCLDCGWAGCRVTNSRRWGWGLQRERERESRGSECISVARLDYLVTGVSTSGPDLAMLRYMLLTLHVFYVPWFLYHTLA